MPRHAVTQRLFNDVREYRDLLTYYTTVRVGERVPVVSASDVASGGNSFSYGLLDLPGVDLVSERLHPVPDVFGHGAAVQQVTDALRDVQLALRAVAVVVQVTEACGANDV